MHKSDLVEIVKLANYQLILRKIKSTFDSVIRSTYASTKGS